jgi:hypothetical protein
MPSIRLKGVGLVMISDWWTVISGFKRLAYLIGRGYRL